MQKEPGSLIVTGGSSGIGKAVLDTLSPRFLRKHVLNIDVRADQPIDVRNYGDVLHEMNRVIVSGRKNFLFANAGVIFLAKENERPVDFISSPVGLLHDMVDINLKGQINVLKAFIQLLMTCDATGEIIVVSSISSFHVDGPEFAVYAATKAAVTHLAKNLAPYWPKIRINVLSPGSVRTNIGGWNYDFSVNQMGLEIVKNGQDADKEALGKDVEMEEIVRNVEFLFFADHGRNGTDNVVDGGLTLNPRTGYKA